MCGCQYSQCESVCTSSSTCLVLSCCPLSDPRTGKWLRGSQVLRYLGSDSGSLGLVAMKDSYMEWCTELEGFLFGEAADDCASEEVPPGTGYFICSFSFLSEPNLPKAHHDLRLMFSIELPSVGHHLPQSLLPALRRPESDHGSFDQKSNLHHVEGLHSPIQTSPSLRYVNGGAAVVSGGVR